MQTNKPITRLTLNTVIYSYICSTCKSYVFHVHTKQAKYTSNTVVLQKKAHGRCTLIRLRWGGGGGEANEVAILLSTLSSQERIIIIIIARTTRYTRLLLCTPEAVHIVCDDMGVSTLY